MKKKANKKSDIIQKAIIIVLIIALLAAIVILGVGYYKKATYVVKNPIATIEVENYGTMKIELYPDQAPNTVNNFITLANNQFYDGLTFHRIIKDFMIQGGDPLHNGTGGSKNKIKGEFKDNGVNNNISHKKGVISMARSSDYDSASSQFFIVTKDSTFLDGKYAAFGVVTSGLDVVLKISDVKAIDDNGTVEYKNQPVIEYIKVVND